MISVDQLTTEPKKTCRLFPSYRLFVILIVSYGTACIRGTNSAISFAIVCMVNMTALVQSGNKYNNSAIPSGCQKNYTEPELFGTGKFVWDSTIQSIILAAYSWGAIVSLMPASFVINRFGVKKVFLVANIVNAIASFLTPIVAKQGYGGLCALLILQGASGISWPCIIAVTYSWVPHSEAGLLIGIASCGHSVGPIISMLVSGFMCSTVGWPYIFYFWGCLCSLWVIVWLIFYNDTPSDCKFLKLSEREFFLSMTESGKLQSTQQQNNNVPIYKLFLSLPVLAVLVANFSDGWLTSYISNILPTFLREVLYLNFVTNGIYSAIPPTVQIVGRLSAGYLSDKFSQRFPSTITIKIFNTIAEGTPAILLLSISFMDCSMPKLVIATFAISYFALSMITGGYSKSIYYIAPQFGATVISLATLCGYFAQISLPYAVGALTTHYTRSEWMNTLYLTSAIMCFGVLFFIIFGSGEKQIWQENHTKPKHVLGKNDDAPVHVTV